MNEKIETMFKGVKFRFGEEEDLYIVRLAGEIESIYGNIEKAKIKAKENDAIIRENKSKIKLLEEKEKQLKWLLDKRKK